MSFTVIVTFQVSNTGSGLVIPTSSYEAYGPKRNNMHTIFANERTLFC